MVKKVALVMSVVLLAAGMAQADLVGQWTFNEGSGIVAWDDSGFDNHGINYGADYVDMGGGNYALDFRPTAQGEGGGDMVDYGDVEQMPSWLADWTIEVWVNVRSGNFGNTVTIMGQDNQWAGLHGWWRFKDYAGASYTADITAPFNTVMDTWYHVVAVHDGNLDTSLENDHILYIDGVEVARDVGFGYRNNSARVSWESGKTSEWVAYGEQIHWFDGLLDEVRLYNHPLSLAEVEANYAAGPTIPEPATMSLLLLGLGAFVSRRK